MCRMDHVFLDVLYSTTNLFSRIENIQGVKNVFHLRKKLDHARREHEGEVGCAHNSIAMLTSDGTFVLRDQAIHLVL